MDKKHTILITGAAGYVGAMLVEQFAKRDDVARIIGLDKEPMPEDLHGQSKLAYLNLNTADDWEERVRAHHPDIVIHAAWQIREMYGAQDLEWKWNIGGSDKVFDFALGEKDVDRLIYFSTVSSYGALAGNSVDHFFTEDEGFRKTQYRYAEEKRVAEEHLQEKYAKSDTHTMVAVLRPAAITGPRGRYMRIRFGLQATLAGQMKGGIYSIISAMVSFVPVTPKWLRQFIHEDDVVSIVERMAFGPKLASGYEAFNICPPGPVVRGKDMAKAVGKNIVPVYPWMVRLAFFVFWHLTRGKIPTGRGAWKGYSFPIAVSGEKLTRVAGYRYRYGGLEAFRYTDGEYESYVPEAQRRHPGTASVGMLGHGAGKQ
ncbi:MAG TPA: NAD-dependent epimerase/dehydratase family protein [Candidatus Paceibacterota bacterium]|nr:NAD-dependent epimerase/dehydratase family protein [Candidatus Paceibacterota bacterium]